MVIRVATVALMVVVQGHLTMLLTVPSWGLPTTMLVTTARRNECSIRSFI